MQPLPAVRRHVSCRCSVPVPTAAPPIPLQAARLTYDSPAALQGCSHLRTLRSLSLDGLFPSEGGSRAGGVHALLGQALGLTELRLNHVLTDEEDGGFWCSSQLVCGGWVGVVCG